MGAHKCLARAVAASNAGEDVHGYSPLQHALGRAPDLDGRFYTAEYEALPTIQAELVTYGNNFKRMQDSDVKLPSLDAPQACPEPLIPSNIGERTKETQ